ncbi:undecaprenyldiphospho-muramoylpentapeptide beta-N-acetylglucosaminyltransferase [Negadavirga shengliensis]|uniref:UDP-N-acetylglucosamine--N-acetylmuramyl-(pentapeptide) pyrophosphoryl-undecaprenol N-acetylglucosamine transferase n=1 Tax=Negadavirga shengliensis TaxID=1389218 RepID=A0ABV9T1Z6_9BACT
MTESKETYRLIISGGGTGGHVYPAIAIANAWTEKYPESEILFVGAKGKMEMQKVPEAGYRIEGLRIAGIQRKLSIKNLSFPFKVLDSLHKSRKLLKNFNPHLVVGVGGYASGPVLFSAQRKGIPTVIQEQNSYAGITNKLLAKNAKAICVAYLGMDEFFPADRLHYTGNPVRKDILHLEGKKGLGLKHFGLQTGKPVVLVLGGSLGARTINQAVLGAMPTLSEKGYQVLWQTGKFYYEEMEEKVRHAEIEGIFPLEFIKEMDLAYAAADIVVSRAGALSVSELSLVGKPVVFIPSPNVAEDHQTKNAMAYVSKEAAILLPDDEAVENLAVVIQDIMEDHQKQEELGRHILELAKPDAAKEIVKVMESIIR